MRLSRSQLAILAGRSARSSAYDAALAELVRADHLHRDGSQLALTDRGLAAVGSAAAQIVDAAEVRQTWLNVLPAYGRELLRALIDAYPEGLSRRDLAARTGRSLTSSAFDGAIGTLRKNGLVSLESGELRASETMFLEVNR